MRAVVSTVRMMVAGAGVNASRGGGRAEGEGRPAEPREALAVWVQSRPRARTAPTRPNAAAREHDGARVLSRTQTAVWAAIGVVWIGAAASFWGWWLGHASAGGVLYWLQTVGLGYQTTLLPTVFWYYVGRMH